MDYYAQSSAAVFAALKTKKEGLSSKEAAARLKSYGPNDLPKRKSTPLWQLFLNEFKNMLVIILIAAAVISLFLGEQFDAVLILVIVFFNAIFGFIQEYHSERAIEALEKMLTPFAVVLRDGEKKKISALDLVPGEIVILSEGDSIPADMRLFESHDIEVSEALLTGESQPISKMTETLRKGTLMPDQKNMVFSGTLVTRGEGLGIVTATGMQTELGKISKMLETVAVEPTPLQKRLEEFGKILGKGIVGLCGVIFFLEVFSGLEFLEAFLTAISLAVAAIPEGLPAVVTIALATGVSRMMRQKALVRRLPAVEALGSVTVICTDKTGTLTKNEMTVMQLYINGAVVHLTTTGFAEKVTHPDLELLLRIGALCNDASLQGDTVIGDPTEGALLLSAQKAGFNLKKLNLEYPRKDVLPFTSARAMMTTIHKTEEGLHAYTKGAVSAILPRCTHYLKNGKKMLLTKKDKERFLQQEHAMASHALRVLAFAYCPLKKKNDAEKNIVFVGLQGMLDPPREGVKEAIAICKEAGIKVVMITGDHKTTATAIANSLDITGESLSGEELQTMSDEELQKHADHVTIYARATPKDKIRIVSALQRLGHIVAMTGDGVNDAPALKKADIGIAMGMRGTEVAKQASSIVLTDDHFTTIVSAVREGRRIFDNVKKFIDTLLSCNLSEVLLVFSASVAQLPLPITAVQLLWINLVTDGLPALALSVDPESPGVMKRPPRNPKEKLLPFPLLMDIISTGFIIGLSCLAIFFLELPKGLAHAQTMAFTGIVLGEFVRLFIVRRKFATSIFENLWLLLSIAVALLLQLGLLYTPLSAYFRTVPLTPDDWMVLGAVLLAMTALSLLTRFLTAHIITKTRRSELSPP